MKPRNIYLVGFMGTGKTTIGRELSRAMGRQFIDVDLELERREGMTVNQIFATHGEPYFRDQELELARELASKTNKVVGTGGGTIMNPEIFEMFQDTGALVCLYTERDNLVKRLQRTDKRPLLSSETPSEVAEKVDRLMQERRLVYDQVKLRLNTTELTPMVAARKLQELFKSRPRLLSHKLKDRFEI